MLQRRELGLRFGMERHDLWFLCAALASAKAVMPEDALIEREKRLQGEEGSLEDLAPANNDADLESGNNHHSPQVLLLALASATTGLEDANACLSKALECPIYTGLGKS